VPTQAYAVDVSTAVDTTLSASAADGGADFLMLVAIIGLALLVLLGAIAGLLTTQRNRRRARLATALRTDAELRPRAAVVVNPTKVSDIVTFRTRVTRWMTEQGWDAPLWLETTTEDTGRQATVRAVNEGVDLVFACGGDGTMMAVVSGLARSGVPLGVLPAGTGNLLARNLNLPDDLETAVLTGLTGDDRPVDLGRVSGDDLPDGYHFAVMAGMGFDAALVTDAPTRLKETLGWPAYFVSGFRHLFDRSMRVSLRIDDGVMLRRRAHTVVVGNVGRLTGGLLLLPDALPDDGVLDVVIIAPGGLIGWVRVARRVVLRQRQGVGRHHRAVEHFTARRVEIISERAEPRQLDGDAVGSGTTMRMEIVDHALLVRVPPGRRIDQPDSR